MCGSCYRYDVVFDFAPSHRLEICGKYMFIITVFIIIIENLLLSFALSTSERSLSESREIFRATLCYWEMEHAEAECQLVRE